MKPQTTLIAAASISLMATSTIASAEQQEEAQANVQRTSAVATAGFARFAPVGAADSRKIDYSAWNEAMSYIVLPMGRSLRQTPGNAEPGLGTRRIYGHSSRYRLEGNRVMFSFFTPELKEMVADYRRDLEQTADLLDISQLNRNEQLAYWVNLHNVALIEQIANAWPVRQPKDIEIDGVPLDQAKFITVNGIAMSPRDIRTQIVYPNWRDSKVIYAFWRGDIGGPSIQREAYSGENIVRLLERSGREFINSLRGTQKRSNRLQVSEIYEEARPFYFANWPSDIRAHIDAFADEEVKQLLAETEAVEATIHEYDIADLAGGIREPSYQSVTSDGSVQSFRIPQGMARLLRERDTKMQRIIKENRTGTVTFIPFTPPGEEPASTEVE